MEKPAPIAAVEFERDVWPILTAKCIDCHQAPRKDSRGRVRKPKGDLRLDGRSWILQGGSGGPVLEAGDAEGSELFLRVTLDEDDPDLMPSKGERLSDREVATLRAWIDGGAGFGAWQGAVASSVAKKPQPPQPPKVPSRIVHLESLAKSAKPLPASVIQKVVDATSGRARIVPLWDGSPLLRVEWFAHRADVEDADVAALDKVARHVAVLDLSGTKVTDRAFRKLGRMDRLTSLSLRDTSVTDTVMQYVVGLPNLRSLVLVGTEVTDQGVTSMMQMQGLTDVYLWRTKASSRGVDTLRRALPGARVRFDPGFPGDAPSRPDARPRRR